MTSFAWKRRVGGAVKRDAALAFEAKAREEEDAGVSVGDVDWLSLAPRGRKVFSLEDATSKGERLRREGATLAEAERYWEALQKWDEALLFTPADHRLHEMKAQVYMSLCEVYPAVVSARRAVALNPTWWIAHQTLGRANLGIGEVKLALGCFARAVHLNPADDELRSDDLMWTLQLLDRKRITDELGANQKQDGGVNITEIVETKDAVCCLPLDEGRVVDSPTVDTGVKGQGVASVDTGSKGQGVASVDTGSKGHGVASMDTGSKGHGVASMDTGSKRPGILKKLPVNYVCMRL